MARRIVRPPSLPKTPYDKIPVPQPVTDVIDILTGDILQLLDTTNRKSVVARAEVGAC